MEILLLLASLTMNGGSLVQDIRWEYGATSSVDNSPVQQALTLLGQPVSPVAVVDFEQARRIYARIPGARPLTPDLSGALHAFRLVNTNQIFVNRNSTVYRDAARGRTALGLLKLAGILVHEATHAADGEHAATRLQADFIRSRLPSLPRAELPAARAYLMELEARATALGRGERRVRHLGLRASQQP